MAEKFLIQLTEEAALAVSHTAYVAATPNWAPETHHTMYLVGTVTPKDSKDARRALRVPDADQSKFSALQQAAMVTKDGLNSGSWNV